MWRIYHNPRCSKSRQTLGLLTDNEVHPEIVEYLKSPPSVEELRELVEKLGVRPKDIVRTKETEFRNLSLDLENDHQVLQALAKFPKLLERPIVVRGNRAVVGRPPDNVKSLL